MSCQVFTPHVPKPHRPAQPKESNDFVSRARGRLPVALDKEAFEKMRAAPAVVPVVVAAPAMLDAETRAANVLAALGHRSGRKAPRPPATRRLKQKQKQRKQKQKKCVSSSSSSSEDDVSSESEAETVLRKTRKKRVKTTYNDRPMASDADPELHPGMLLISHNLRSCKTGFARGTAKGMSLRMLQKLWRKVNEDIRTPTVREFVHGLCIVMSIKTEGFITERATPDYRTGIMFAVEHK